MSSIYDYNISKITAELSGPCHHKSIGKKDELEIELTDKSILVRKYQKCGKKCKTCLEGKGHGPYYWKVTYLGKRKYLWKYIGKKLK